MYQAHLAHYWAKYLPNKDTTQKNNMNLTSVKFHNCQIDVFYVVFTAWVAYCQCCMPVAGDQIRHKNHQDKTALYNNLAHMIMYSSVALHSDIYSRGIIINQSAKTDPLWYCLYMI